MNPVLCVFEKLAYKVGKFHKKLAELLGSTEFVVAVLIEFSLRHPFTKIFLFVRFVHGHSLTKGQSSERVT